MEDIYKYMCEKFCGIWANIAAQIASEAPIGFGPIEVRVKQTSHVIYMYRY